MLVKSRKQTLKNRFEEQVESTPLKNQAGQSDKVKWDYLINTVNNLLSEVGSFRNRMNRDKKFLYTTLAAYLAFAAAPVGMTLPLGVDIRLAYGITGAFFSIVLAYFVIRHIRVIGSNLKKNMVAFKQISLIRGIALRAGFFTRDDLVLPTDIDFDCYAPNDPRRYAAKDIGEYSAVPHFYAFINVFLLAAFFFFVSVAMYSWTLKGLPVAQRSNDLFRLDFYYAACLVMAPIAWLFIHWQRNACLKFHKRLWEAKRVRPGNPNPSFPDIDGWSKSATRIAAQISLPLLALFWVPNLVFALDREAFSAITDIAPWLHGLVGFGPFLLSCALLMAGKAADIQVRLTTASKLAQQQQREKIADASAI